MKDSKRSKESQKETMMNTKITLRSLDKERYLIKIGDKAISKMEEPFKDILKEFNKFKKENMDDEGRVGDMDFEDNDLFAEDYCKILYIEKEWDKLKNQLNDISCKTSRVVPKSASAHKNLNSNQQKKVKPLYYDVTEGRIRSEKNTQALGDTSNLDERNSDGSETKVPINKPHIKPTKPSGMKKTTGENATELIANSGRKKTMSQYTAGTTHTHIEKTVKYAQKINAELLISSNDSDIGGIHKKPRQPKQRVGNSSKVSSSEKEPQKAKEKGLSVNNEENSDEADDFCVILKNDKKSKQSVKEKSKTKVESKGESKTDKNKKKRTSVRDQIRAAKTNKNPPPMVFCCVAEDEIPKPRRNLMRTPPRPNNPAQSNNADSIGCGGGIMMRDDYVANPRVTRGPVKRSPPRLDEKRHESSEEDNIKTGIVSQASNENSNFETQSTPPKLIPERQISSPSTINPLKNLTENRQSPDYIEPRLYDEFINKNTYPSSPKTQINSYDPSKITTFGSRIDELLAETKNKIDEITPKTEYGGAHVEGDFSKGYNYNYMTPAQMSSYPHPDTVVSKVINSFTKNVHT